MKATRTCVWQGASGRSYEYWVYPWPTEFKNVPGNYIFAKVNSRNLWEAVYIGETSDLSERFDKHHAMPCINRNGVTHIHVHANNDGATARRKEEADLIAKYSPVCNS